MGASFYSTKSARARKKGGHQWEREREIEHFDYLLPLSGSGAVLEFLHFIPRSLNGVPQSLTLWYFMWDRGTKIQFIEPRQFFRRTKPCRVASNCEILIFVSPVEKK